jgi:kinetochore protein NDC80
MPLSFSDDNGKIKAFLSSETLVTPLSSKHSFFVVSTVIQKGNTMQRTRTSSRRQTLGGVSVNHGRKGSQQNGSVNNNRRQSVDPSSHGHSAVKSRPPRKGRASMIPRVGRENILPPTPMSTARDPKRRVSSAMGSGRRRSGVGGDYRQSIMPSTTPTIIDPRPITDKSYQIDCIKELFAFLQKSGYDHPISQKSLSRPSGKDFSNIVTFMLRRVDPGFQDGTLKIEDEIAMNFKAMGYPFAVSKTALVAAGSPHTWPTLLAALTWLMKRLQCMEHLITDEADSHSGAFESVEELERKTDRFFFSYLSASYMAFLKGDEKLREELEMGLADRLEGDDNILMQEIEQMTDQNAAIVEKMNNLSLGEKE